MAEEPPPISNNTTSPSPSSSADSYIGSFISVTSKCEIRYEGVLYYLNPQDSTFGLKDVRSFGTEGRSKTGQQVPPSDKVYEYILFRGCDIKDLRVITSPSVQIEEPIFNDPAIIQSKSNSHVSSSVSVSSAYNTHTEPQFSRTQLELWESSQLRHNPTPTQWPGYSGAGDVISGASNVSNNISPENSSTTSTSIFFTVPPALTSEQPPTTLTDSFPLKTSYFPFPQPTFINPNGLTMPEDQFVNKVAPNSMPDPISDPQQNAFFTPNLSQPKFSEHYPAKTLYPDHKDISVMSSTSLNFSSSAATPEVQPPLLPLPPSSQKLHATHFDEEFDFQAMNEKFKKDEVWGYLGKSNQRENVEEENCTSTLEPEMISAADPKPAYKKDDFFDTISCNSIVHGARNGQNRFSERMKLDSQTFDDFQRGNQFGGGRGDHHNWTW